MGKKYLPKVLLIQPPVYDFAYYDLFAKPYGLFRLAQWFSREGYKTEFLDCLDWEEPETLDKLGEVKRSPRGTGKVPKTEVPFPFRDMISFRRRFHRYGILPQVIRRRIRESQPQLVCITTGMTYWYPGVWEVIEIVEELLPSIPVFVGGVYATLMGDHLQKRYPDIQVIRGSGISQLASLLEHNGFDKPQSDIPSFPGTDTVFWKGAAVIRLNQGCPLNCDYCASRLLDSRFSPGDPEAAADWLAEMQERTGIRSVAFYDDALLIEKEKVLLPLLERLIDNRQNSFQFYTPNGLHIRGMDEQTARLMKQAGFQEIRLGFESSLESFHASYDAKSSQNSFKDCLRALRQGGFSPDQIRVYILAGLPGQPWEEVEASIEYASSSKTAVSVAEYTPVPGTALWEQSCRESPYPLSDEPLFHNNTLQPLAWDGFTREDMQRVKLLARQANQGMVF